MRDPRGDSGDLGEEVGGTVSFYDLSTVHSPSTSTSTDTYKDVTTHAVIYV